MKEAPNDTELNTFYAGIRNGDDPKTICKILNIPYRQFSYWKKQGKRYRKKKSRGEKLTKSENACLKLYKLVRSASYRRRRDS